MILPQNPDPSEADEITMAQLPSKGATLPIINAVLQLPVGTQAHLQIKAQTAW